MANKSSLKIGDSMKELRQKNNMGEYQKSEPERVVQEQVGEKVEPAKRSVGRQPKERKIKRTYPKTIYFDEPTSMKLSDVRTKDKIEIKDLVLVATIEFLKRNFNEEERCLSEASKDYIRKEMDKILEVFSE
ncbi:MAG: hypothetical protein IJA95_06560 [Bacteroidaceae bacterium]|nr:hypothetical protein [Bacteroidaceae bacterium]